MRFHQSFTCTGKSITFKTEIATAFVPSTGELAASIPSALSWTTGKSLTG